MLHENQSKLIRHLARFNLMDYQDCLDMLDTEGVGDRTALSYVFRPLTKNKYLSKDENDCVSILAKGRALFPELTPLISTGGKDSDRRRVMKVSRMAALMEHNGIPVVADCKNSETPYFIPSACWRRIASGILSTTRFTGMLVAGTQRLAVYDIGDGKMEWQARAEGSLFYTQYGSYETKATGILFICQKDVREKAAQNIIRQTMWHRRKLLKENCLERNKPMRWSHAPIRLKAQYEHVYLTTPESLLISLQRIFLFVRKATIFPWHTAWKYQMLSLRFPWIMPRLEKLYCRTSCGDCAENTPTGCFLMFLRWTNRSESVRRKYMTRLSVTGDILLSVQ